MIDTPGFGDTRADGQSFHVSLVDFFISLSSGIDVLLYFVRYGAMNAADLDLFLDVYKRILSVDAYENSCLIISDYSLPNLEEVNRENSDERQVLLKQLHENDKYSYILKKFSDRVLFIDVSPFDQKRREMSKKILTDYLSFFQPKQRFNCQNLQETYRLIRRTQEMETHCFDLQSQIVRLNTQNEQLTHLYEKQMRRSQDLEDSYQQSTRQLQQIHEQTLVAVEHNHLLTIEEMKQHEFDLRVQVKQVRQQLEEIEHDMERSLTFNVISYIPLMHIVTNIIELNTKRRITQRIRQLLHSKKKLF